MSIRNSNVRLNFNKENTTAEPSKQTQRLRIQLSDKLFEIRKLQEDYAQQRAKLFIEVQKEKQITTRIIKELKDKNVYDNEEWTKKIDQIRNECIEVVKQTQLKHQILLEEQKEIVKKETKLFYDDQIKQLALQTRYINATLQQKQERWKKEKLSLIEQMSHNFTKKQLEMSQKNQKLIEELKKDFSSKIISMQNIWIEEQNLRIGLNMKIEEQTRQYVKQKIQWQKCDKIKDEQFHKQTLDIRNLQKIIKQMKEEEIILKAAHQKQILTLQSKNQQEIQHLKEITNLKKQQILTAHEQQIVTLRKEFIKIEEIYKAKESLWQERGRRILQLYQKRQSKREDVKTIEHLEVQLIKRQFMLERERKELKHCRLELQNMEDVYDKIFICNPYLGRSKSKSFKIKKIKPVSLLYESNRSTIIEEKKNGMER